MHGQVTHAQSLHSSNVCHLFPPMLEVLFSFLVHTFSGGLSRVASAMSSPTRSRSPMRTASVHDDKAEEPKENPDALTQVGLGEQGALPEAPSEGPKERRKIPKMPMMVHEVCLPHLLKSQLGSSWLRLL